MKRIIFLLVLFTQIASAQNHSYSRTTVINGITWNKIATDLWINHQIKTTEYFLITTYFTNRATNDELQFFDALTPNSVINAQTKMFRETIDPNVSFNQLVIENALQKYVTKKDSTVEVEVDCEKGSARKPIVTVNGSLYTANKNGSILTSKSVSLKNLNLYPEQSVKKEFSFKGSNPIFVIQNIVFSDGEIIPFPWTTQSLKEELKYDQEDYEKAHANDYNSSTTPLIFKSIEGKLVATIPMLDGFQNPSLHKEVIEVKNLTDKTITYIKGIICAVILKHYDDNGQIIPEYKDRLDIDDPPYEIDTSLTINPQETKTFDRIKYYQDRTIIFMNEFYTFFWPKVIRFSDGTELSAKNANYWTFCEESLSEGIKNRKLSLKLELKANSLGMCTFGNDIKMCLLTCNGELKASRNMSSVSLENSKAALETAKLHFNQVKTTLSDSTISYIKKGIDAVSEQFKTLETSPLTDALLEKGIAWNSIMMYHFEDIKKNWCQ